MTERDKAILDYLKKNHKGKSKAVHSKELEIRFQICGRSLRTTIGRLRRDHYPICSSDNGYFYGVNQTEVNATVCWLDELVMNISGSRTGLLKSSLRRK